MIQDIREAVEFIRSRTSFVPDYGIILGTGLGKLAAEITVAAEVAYEEIPHFPVSTVESHSGRLLFGTLGSQRVVAMQGRFHYYEGYTMPQVTFPVRVMKLLGIQTLIVTNAAGGLNPEFAISDLMIINDHINLLPENPLTGKNLDELGPRFPDMSEVYDPELIKKALGIAVRESMPVHTGVYVSVPGPNLETRAEYRYLRTIGADAVGMSTVPEIIVARHMNLPCFALSVITDMCTPETIKKVTVPEIIAAAAKAEPVMTRLITQLLLNEQPMPDTSTQATLEAAAEGLLYPSESDYPFTYFTWGEAQTDNLSEDQVRELAGQPEDAAVETISLEKLFKPLTEIKDWYEAEDKENVKRFEELQETIQRVLHTVQVFRVGEIEIDVYIVGKDPQGNWAGLKTISVET
jgi:purine-nucleoside phosphorylase